MIDKWLSHVAYAFNYRPQRFSIFSFYSSVVQFGRWFGCNARCGPHWRIDEIFCFTRIKTYYNEVVSGSCVGCVPMQKGTVQLVLKPKFSVSPKLYDIYIYIRSSVLGIEDVPAELVKIHFYFFFRISINFFAFMSSCSPFVCQWFSLKFLCQIHVRLHSEYSRTHSNILFVCFCFLLILTHKINEIHVWYITWFLSTCESSPR